MKLESLRELLVEQCQDLYDGEKQIIKALPDMIEEAQSPELKTALKSHLEETKTHVMRLEQVFGALDEDVEGKKCKGMEGLIKEGKDMLDEDAEPEVMDAGIIAAAQRVEHYEIAGYGCARTYAQLLGVNDAARLLQQTLDEEAAADRKLTGIAEKINVEARKVA